MKRMWTSFAFILALLLLSKSALATGEVGMEAAFFQDDQFYTFAALGEQPESLSAELRTGRLTLPANLGPEPLAGSGLPVFYLLLADGSQDTRPAVSGFAAALARRDHTEAQFALATFKEDFSLQWEGERDDLVGAVSRMTWASGPADLNQGILGALDYLAERPRRAGELVNLVVIACPPEAKDGGNPFAEATRRLEEERSVLTHTFCPQSSSAEELESLKGLGRGLHLENGRAGVKGRLLAEYVNKLYVTRFTWSLPNNDEAELRLAWEDAGELRLTEDMAAVPVLAVATPPGNGTLASAPPVESQPASEPPVPTESLFASGPPEPVETLSPLCLGASGQKVLWVAAGAGTAALAAILVLVFQRRNTKKNGISMQLEVISGTYAGSGRLYLSDELIVGRGRCDIPWKDREVSPRQARIFRRDGLVYIEDLNSALGTALGGMRIYHPNRLRSEDEISVGTVRFRLKF